MKVYKFFLVRMRLSTVYRSCLLYYYDTFPFMLHLYILLCQVMHMDQSQHLEEQHSLTVQLRG